MRNRPLTEEEAGKLSAAIPWIVILIIIIFAYFASACAVDPLFRPDNGKMITWISEDYIYTGTYLEPKKDSIPNYWGCSYCVGDVVYKY